MFCSFVACRYLLFFKCLRDLLIQKGVIKVVGGCNELKQVECGEANEETFNQSNFTFITSSLLSGILIIANVTYLQLFEICDVFLVKRRVLFLRNNGYLQIIKFKERIACVIPRFLNL